MRIIRESPGSGWYGRSMGCRGRCRALRDALRAFWNALERLTVSSTPGGPPAGGGTSVEFSAAPRPQQPHRC
eukprot:8435517-Pyramimonas_sp.AAC.1